MPTSGETDLDRLLAGMKPRLDPEIYVFATVDRLPAGLSPLMTFQETEGLTLILSQHSANAAGLLSDFVCRRITLEIHSALDAVGFLARITTTLAAEGFGVNPVSGFYHDHLFVPAERAEEAIDRKSVV